jgi:tRNA-2-methylthio-N6-dimethylallyladenosine synthase
MFLEKKLRMKYHIVQLGCQMNISDGERVQKVLEEMGFEPTDREEEANLLGVIACSVRQKAIDKVYSRIRKWNRWKNKKNLLTFVTGCVLPADREKFLKQFDLVFAMNELPDLPDMIWQYGIVTPAGMQNLDKEWQKIKSSEAEKERHKADTPRLKAVVLPHHEEKLSHPEKGIEEFWHITPKYGSGWEAFIPIQNGCNKFCTYCAVPYTRGREVSRPSSEIMNELRDLVEKGYKSITLLGQNVNSYGLDKKGEEVSFAELLRMIGEFGNSRKEKFWVYFTSPHPRDMTDEVIEVIARYSCLAKQIHLPIQSGDDAMLVRMNRKHTVEKYRHIVQTIRRLLPEATLFTDIIVGFTGETEEQIENTRKAMEEFKYNMAYIAQYSPRPGAASSRWADDIPKEVKKARYHLLTDELMKHSLAYNQGLIGKTMTVLVRGRDRKKGYLSALTEGKIIVRFASDDENLIGQFVTVKIRSAAPFSMEGDLVAKEILQPVNA